jgi:lipoate-protein ligase B
VDRASAWLLDLGGGARPYAEVWALQRDLVRARQAGLIPDALILVEHQPVITMGRSADEGHLLASPELLASRGIDLFQVERGGSATYHGPGQLVGYPILDLRQWGEDVGRYMRTLEATIIDTVATYGIDAGRRPGYPGVWVNGAKICAMGVAIKRRVTMHGFALNVSTDLDAFTLINPCGLGLAVTSILSLLGCRVDLGDVALVYAARFAEHFEVDFTRVDEGHALSAARVTRADLAGPEADQAGSRGVFVSRR